MDPVIRCLYCHTFDSHCRECPERCKIVEKLFSKDEDLMTAANISVDAVINIIAGRDIRSDDWIRYARDILVPNIREKLNYETKKFK